MSYWLMKSEPNCYSIHDLKKAGRDIWEGCRNYTVRNFIRDSMSDGDMAFFYNSNCDPTGIIGVMKIVGDAYPDPTQFDPSSRYFDPKSTVENPRWFARDVEYVSEFPRCVTLSEMRSVPGLEDMEVLRRGQRLSVMPVTEAEWAIVTNLAK